MRLSSECEAGGEVLRCSDLCSCLFYDQMLFAHNIYRLDTNVRP